ncbi:MAG: peptidylprolyl isomerase [Acidimicrobiia bacterium]
MARAEKRQRKKDRQRQRIEAEVREWRTRRRRRLAINLAVLAVVVGAIAFLVYRAARPDEEPKKKEATVACDGKKPSRKEVGPFPEAPAMAIDQAKSYTAVLTTSCGVVEIELADDVAPQTVNSFVFLARNGFFDGLNFHRLAEGFVLQGGDPEGSGSGGPGYQVVEAPPPATEYPLGTVAMAKAGNEAAGTSGSQFFIVSGEGGAQLNGTPEQPALYALLGKVVNGLDVVAKMEKVGAKPQSENPRLPIYIDSITIRET